MGTILKQGTVRGPVFIASTHRSALVLSESSQLEAVGVAIDQINERLQEGVASKEQGRLLRKTRRSLQRARVLLLKAEAQEDVR